MESEEEMELEEKESRDLSMWKITIPHVIMETKQVCCLYSEKVEIYGTFELITESYFVIGLSERYGDIKRETTKKCSTLRDLTAREKRVLETLFVARQV